MAVKILCFQGYLQTALLIKIVSSYLGFSYVKAPQARVLSLGDSYHSVILKRNIKVFSKCATLAFLTFHPFLPLTDNSLHMLHAQKPQYHILFFIQVQRILFSKGNYKIRDSIFFLTWLKALICLFQPGPGLGLLI